jgi:ISXO2 transposase-like protein
MAHNVRTMPREASAAQAASFKRGVRGTWHHISAKHLASYLEEMSFRFNNRKHPYLFRDTIIKLIASPNLEYKRLTSKAQDAAA